MKLYFSPYLTSASALPGGNTKQRIAYKGMNAECFCQQIHKTHSHYHLVTAEPPFICTRIDHMHQTKPRKGV